MVPRRHSGQDTAGGRSADDDRLSYYCRTLPDGRVVGYAGRLPRCSAHRVHCCRLSGLSYWYAVLTMSQLTDLDQAVYLGSRRTRVTPVAARSMQLFAPTSRAL